MSWSNLAHVGLISKSDISHTYYLPTSQKIFRFRKFLVHRKKIVCLVFLPLVAYFYILTIRRRTHTQQFLLYFFSSCSFFFFWIGKTAWYYNIRISLQTNRATKTKLISNGCNVCKWTFWIWTRSCNLYCGTNHLVLACYYES